MKRDKAVTVIELIVQMTFIMSIMLVATVALAAGEQPQDWIEALQQIIEQGGAGAWPAALALVTFVATQVILGKAGFQIPFLTDQAKRIPNEYLPLILCSLTALAGMFTALGTELSLQSAVSGLLQGVVAALGATGIHQAVHQPTKKD